MIDRWLLTPAPAERLAALRLLVGGFALGYLLVRLPHLLDVAAFDPRRFEPVGPLAWMGRPLAPATARAVLAVVLVAGVGFVAGWRWRLTGPSFALGVLVVAAYRNSWGHVLHTDHLVTLHLLVLAATPAADAWSLDRRRRQGPGAAPDARYGWGIRVMCLATVCTYVLAGWAKLRNGGVDWLTGDVLRNHVAYDNLRKALLGDVYSPVGARLVAHPWLFVPFAWLTVAVELGAPLALLGGRWRTLWCAAAWAFHLGVVVVMAIMFPYPVLGVAYASFFAVERPVGAVAGQVATVARRLGRVNPTA